MKPLWIWIAVAVAVVAGLIVWQQRSAKSPKIVEDVLKKLLHGATERAARFELRVTALAAAWDANDRAALGAFYPERLSSRRGNLAKRLEARGHGAVLPMLSDPMFDREQTQTRKRAALFDMLHGQLRTIWKWEDGDWWLVQLVLPKARPREVTDEEPDPDRAGAPFLRVQMDSADAWPGLTATKLSELLSLLALPVAPRRLSELWAGMRFPLELEVSMLPDGLGVGGCMRMPDEGAFVVEWMLEEARRLYPDIELPAELRPNHVVRNASFRDLPVGGMRFFEGGTDANHLAFVPWRLSPPQRFVRSLVFESPERSATEEALARALADAPLRATFVLEPFVAALAEETREQITAVKRDVGTVRGVALGLRTVGDAVVLEGALDIGVGALTEVLGGRDRLDGWVPDSVESLVSLSFDPVALRRVAEAVRASGASLDPARWAPELQMLGRGDVGGLLERFDGNLLLCQAGASAETGGALVVAGTEDSVELRRELASRFAPLGLEVRTAFDVTRRAYAFAPADGEPVFFAVEREGALLLSGASEASRVLLTQALARDGRGRLPQRVRERMPELPDDAAVVLYGSHPGAVAFLAGIDSMAGWVASTPDGVLLRVVTD